MTHPFIDQIKAIVEQSLASSKALSEEAMKEIGRLNDELLRAVRGEPVKVDKPKEEEPKEPTP